MNRCERRQRNNRALIMLLFAVCFGLFLDVGVPTVEKTVPKVLDTVVMVGSSGTTGFGSGVCISPLNVLTARHVVAGKRAPFYVILNSGQKITVADWRVSTDYDIAVLRLEVPVKHYAKIGSFADCRLGQTLFSIGTTRERAMFNAVGVGNLQKQFLQSDAHTGWNKLFALTAEGGPGNSGCPVFTLNGSLIGIWVGSRQPNIHYAIPIDAVTEELKIIELLFLMSKWKTGSQYESVQGNNAFTHFPLLSLFSGGGERGYLPVCRCRLRVDSDIRCLQARSNQRHDSIGNRNRDRDNGQVLHNIQH